MRNCRYDANTLRKGGGYNHTKMRIYTSRWNKVFRHDVGHAGQAAACDELGWVSVEEFIRNDHAWPIDDPRAVKRYCSKEEGS